MNEMDGAVNAFLVIFCSQAAYKTWRFYFAPQIGWSTLLLHDAWRNFLVVPLSPSQY